MSKAHTRRYYTDAYTTTFTAQVTEVVRQDGRTAVVLDQTYFYPDAGGQPADKGTLAGQQVIDVAIREHDQAILHWLADSDTALPATMRGEIDWARRFDHMQQHTGQHILSRAFINTAEAETVSFHLGQELATIDIAHNQLTAVAITQAEQLANQIIWENHPITARFVTLEEAAKLPLRKQPDIASDYLRLVDIADFDLTACGGTHVAHTGEVGLIKVVKLERRKENTRVTFVCGRRALADFTAKQQVVHDLTTELTTAPSELLSAIQKMQSESKMTRRQIRQLHERLAQYEVAAYRQAAEHIGDVALITVTLDDRDPRALRALVQALLTDVTRPTVVLAGCAGQKSSFICQRSEDAPGQMNEVLLAGLATLDLRSGGGTAVLAQGSAPSAKLTQVQQVVSAARQNWLTAVL
jgi:alanyl-tRNA synthetase